MRLSTAVQYVIDRIMGTVGCEEIPTNTQIQAIVQEAIKRLSERKSNYTSTDDTAIANQKNYDRPANCIRIIYVQNVDDTEDQDSPVKVGFQDYGEQFYLNITPTTSWVMRIWHTAYWPAMTDLADTTIPVRLHEALLDKAASLACTRMAAQAARNAESTSIGNEKEDLKARAKELRAASKQFEDDYKKATMSKGLKWTQGRTANDRAGNWP